MVCLNVFVLFVFVFVSSVLPQGSGSETNGKLRLCVGRGSYKRASNYCSVLDQSDSGVECDIGHDRWNCLIRLDDGYADFGVFSAEDLIPAKERNVGVLVTHEVRLRPRNFSSSIVAVIRKNLLPVLNSVSSVHSILKGSSMCHIGLGADERQPFSETITEYLESLVTKKSCNSSLTVAENRIKAIADTFSKACRPGPWVMDAKRDAELKAKYPSLCAACGQPSNCDRHDRYWGPSGAFSCLTEGAGNFTWADADFVLEFFHSRAGLASPDEFAYLCRDGSWQEIRDNEDPCVWLRRPWQLLVAQRKAANEVRRLVADLTSAGVVVNGWRGALMALLEVNDAVLEPLRPPLVPEFYLDDVDGSFKGAYGQAGCTPPRDIVMCTASVVAAHKCNWLGIIASVYGVEPTISCDWKIDEASCLEAVQYGDCDVTVASADWLVRAERDMSLTPILHEITPIVNQSTTVVAYVREDAKIFRMAELKNKRAAFPRFDGFAWHSVLRYLANVEKSSCKDIIHGYFSSICAPGVENYFDGSKKWTESCAMEEGKIVEGEWGALRALVEGRSDVAFLSMATYNQYVAKEIPEPWVKDVKIKPICAEDDNYCFISWSNIGHILAKNTTAMRRQEIINVLTKLDQLFGKQNPNLSSALMFSLYGLYYNSYNNVLFHDNTTALATSDVLRTHPFDKIPLNFERNLTSIDSCHVSDLTGGVVNVKPAKSAGNVRRGGCVSVLFIIFSFIIIFRSGKW